MLIGQHGWTTSNQICSLFILFWGMWIRIPAFLCNIQSFLIVVMLIFCFLFMSLSGMPAAYDLSTVIGSGQPASHNNLIPLGMNHNYCCCFIGCVRGDQSCNVLQKLQKWIMAATAKGEKREMFCTFPILS